MIKTESVAAETSLSDLARWCCEMELEDEGHLALTNIIHDKRTGRLPSELIAEFLRRVVDTRRAMPAPPSRLVGERSPALKAFDQTCTVMAEEHRARCQGLPRIRTREACSHMMQVKDFLALIDTTKAVFTYDGGLLEDELADLERMDSLEAVVVRHAHVPPTRPLAWVTKTSAVDRLRASSSSGRELASKVRAALGLHHHMGMRHYEVYYLELRYPPALFSHDDADLRPPTFIDSGLSRVYRSARYEGWGQTVDLDGARPGLPEAVHPPISATSGFRVRDVGEPQREPAFTYSAVVKTAPVPWEHAFIDELEELWRAT